MLRKLEGFEDKMLNYEDFCDKGETMKTLEELYMKNVTDEEFCYINSLSQVEAMNYIKRQIRDMLQDIKDNG